MASARPLPFVAGHWLLGQGPAMRAAGHLALCRIGREAGGVAAFRVLHRRFVAITDAGLAREVLVLRHQSFRRARHQTNLSAIIGDGLLTVEGPLWRQRRRCLNPAFRGAALKPVATLTAETAAAETAEWRAGAVVSAAAAARRLSQAVIARALFARGLDRETSHDLSELVREGGGLVRQHNFALLPLPFWVPTALHRRIVAVRRRLDALVDGLAGGGICADLDGRRDAESGEKALSADALRSEMKTLLAAGFETTAASLAFALALLARHPAIQEACRAEADEVLSGREPTLDDLPRLTMIRAAVDETLRLYPAVHNLSRVATVDEQLGGYRVPRGSVILISIWGIHRDPRLWPDPETFRPERFLPGASWPRHGYLPFGAGQHSCIGSEFALIEMTVALACILQAWRFTADAAGPLPVKASITLSPADEAALMLESR